MSRKAPFVAAVLFFVLLFWTSLSLVPNEGPRVPGVLNLILAQMTIYGFTGIALAVYGAYLYQTGQKTITPPKIIYIVGATVVVVVVALLGIAAVNYAMPVQ